MKPDNLKFCINILISNLGVGYIWHQFSKLFSEACVRQLKQATSQPNDLHHSITARELVGRGPPAPSETLAIMDFFIEITSTSARF